MHTEMIRILYENPEHFKSVCDERNNSFHFACQKRIVD